MLDLANERRKSVMKELIVQELELRKATNPEDYVLVDRLSIRKDSVSDIQKYFELSIMQIIVYLNVRRTMKNGLDKIF